MVLGRVFPPSQDSLSPLRPKSETQQKESFFPSNFQPRPCDSFSSVCVRSVNELLTAAEGVASAASPRLGWACVWVRGQSRPSTWAEDGARSYPKGRWHLDDKLCEKRMVTFFRGKVTCPTGKATVNGKKEARGPEFGKSFATRSCCDFG